MKISNKKMFGYGKDVKFVSFPFDWILPKEFEKDGLNYAGFLFPETLEKMKTLALNRRDIEKLEPIFWMKTNG